MKRLTLRQFRVFEAVARNLSFSRAAEELHLSQPAVSMQVKGIENIVGQPLTEKFGKRIFLTDAGREVLHASHGITALLDDLQTNLAQLHDLEGGRLQIGVTTTANPVTTELLARFRRKYPKIDLHLNVSNRATLLARLEANQVDLGIMGQVPKGLNLTATRFMDNPLGVIAAPDHPLAQQKNISLAALSKEDFLVREIESGTRGAMGRFFSERDIALKVCMEMDSNESIKQAAIVGLGLGILSLQTVALELETKRLVALDVTDFPIMRHWYVVRHSDKRLSKIAQAFHDFVLSEEGRIRDALEQREDQAAIERYLKNGEETFPDGVVAAMVEGQNPIKVYRKHRQMTQQQLADAIGKSKVYIAKIESGERNGSIDALSAIASALKVDVDDLL